MRTFILPDPGEGLTEARISTWHVSEGDEVAVNQVLLEVETVKSLVELPSPWAGKVVQLLAKEDEEVAVGSPIITIEVVGDETNPPGETDPRGVADGDGVESAAANTDSQAEAGDGSTQTASERDKPETLVGYGPKPESSRRRRRTPEPRDEDMNAVLAASYGQDVPSRRADDVTVTNPVTAAAMGEPLPGPGEPDRSQLVPIGGTVRAKPAIRRLAKILGIDLAEVSGTGPNGTVTRADVEAAAAMRDLADESPGQTRPDSSPKERRVPIQGVRKVTAERLIESVNTNVHVTEWVTLDVTRTMEFVETLRARPEFAELRVSPLLVYAKAVCLALGRNPDLNASWDAAGGEIVYHSDVNLGIAAATPRGLMVPNIKSAQRLSLVELCEEINRIVLIARSGKLQPPDYADGTFTITNVGIFGMDAGTPIINPGESAILCMGAIDRRPWVVGTGDGERLEPRWVTTLSMSFDHRLIDGEQGSKFMADVAMILREPELAMMF
ncbi:MAG: diaminohydroxyphosphoribosylaminopyrimidine deaminase [Propionibacteriales bacterium]|nr:MAG: diaminohydroxyphosphoribosylaminopyrimidine deaminase [Propionibacteriales bacterium]